jgi:tripartite-type tricarboxylate transporter receptor subunit TctC
LFDPQVRQRFDELGIQSSSLDQQSPDALRALQKADAARWWPIIRAANIRAE